MNRQTRIIKEVIKMYPEAECELRHNNPYELLIATILSAQTTDKQVNIVTQPLFRDFPDAKSLSKSSPEVIGSYIKTLGFYNAKASNLVATAKLLVDNFDNQVPRSMEELITLPGVGRKTANVVLSNAFGIPGFAVDTHVKRVCFRLGLTQNTDPDKVEKDITSKIPQYMYLKAHHALIFHGRRTCKAVRPLCHQCALTKDCVHYKKLLKEKHV